MGGVIPCTEHAHLDILGEAAIAFMLLPLTMAAAFVGIDYFCDTGSSVGVCSIVMSFCVPWLCHAALNIVSGRARQLLVEPRRVVQSATPTTLECTTYSIPERVSGMHRK